MSLFVAVLLLGQVGTTAEVAGQDNTANVESPAVESPAVQVPDDQYNAEPARPRATAPQRELQRAPARITEADAVSAESSSLPSTPPVRAEPSFPANSRPTVVPVAPATSQSLQVAATMIEEILVLDPQSQQFARRVPLVEAISRLSDPAQQSIAVRSYWELARCIARARYAADRVRVLTEVAAPNLETDRALLEEAVAAAEAEEAAAQDTLLASQYGLLRTTGMPQESVMPWPADAPLVAPYRTQFDAIFAGRAAPLPMRQIHHSLPGKLLLIEKRVSAMAAAEATTDTMLEAYKTSKTPMSQLLAAVDRLDQSRQLFLEAVIDYNHQIADYSLAVVGTGVGPETLVATLIKAPLPNNAALVNVPQRDVRQATAAELAPSFTAQPQAPARPNLMR